MLLVSDSQCWYFFPNDFKKDFYTIISTLRSVLFHTFDLFFLFCMQHFCKCRHKLSLTTNSFLLYHSWLCNKMLQAPLKICAHHTYMALPWRGQEVSPSVLLDCGHDKDRSLVVPGLIPVPHSLPHLYLEIIISPGSFSTDRRATSSSSSSDKGPWFADKLEKSFRLQREEEV